MTAHTVRLHQNLRCIRLTGRECDTTRIKYLLCSSAKGVLLFRAGTKLALQGGFHLSLAYITVEEFVALQILQPVRSPGALMMQERESRTAPADRV